METKGVNYERLSLITGCGFFGVFTAFTTAQSLATSLPGTYKSRNVRKTKALTIDVQEDPRISDTFVLQHFTERFVLHVSSFHLGLRKLDPNGAWYSELVPTF